MSKGNQSELEVHLDRCISKIPDINDICNALTNTSNRILNYFKKGKNQENKTGDCATSIPNNYCNVKNFAFQQCPEIYQGQRKRKRKFEPEAGGEEENSCNAKKECERKTMPNLCPQTLTTQHATSQTYRDGRISTSQVNSRASTSQISCGSTCICNQSDQKSKTEVRSEGDSKFKNNKNDQKVTCTSTKNPNKSPCPSTTSKTCQQTVSSQSSQSKCSSLENKSKETNKNCNTVPINTDINSNAIQMLCSSNDSVKVSSSFAEQLAMVCLNSETRSKTSTSANPRKSILSKSNTFCKNACKNKKSKHSCKSKSRSKISKSLKSIANSGYRLCVTIKPVPKNDDNSTETESECEGISNGSKATTCTSKQLSTCSKQSPTPKSSTSSLHKCSDEKKTCTPSTTEAPCSKKDRCLDQIQKRNEKLIAVAKGWWSALYRSTNGDEDCECIDESWRNLSSSEKLLYIWAAVDNQMVSENPKQNFIFDYTTDKDLKKCRKNKRGQVNEIWKCLSAHERLPYILESLIAKVSACEVNISDVNCVQDTLQKLEKC